MEMLFGPEALWIVSFCCLVAMVAGTVKGVVGFGMPMVLISGLSTVMPPDLALAGLILPTLITNGWQALRQGVAAAWESVRKYRVFLLVGLVFLLGSAQVVRAVPSQVLLLGIGVPIVAYALTSLAGRPLRLPAGAGARTEAAIGAVAGFFGGISGVWGPPTVAMLSSRDTGKTEQMRVQGVIYGLGAVALVVAHVSSGVLNRDTAPFSMILIVPAMVGMWIGFRIQDRLDHATFRKLTFLVLFLAGANLVRRGLWG
ncbi:Sulfite exporter TauE/SafE [Roseovarius albus]|uniref:Probable membrane transporter protein n=1 Tax=Roseovarius albus TaxID=1247867 RepID=A0A1X6YJX7_9RHOB|nr:sulfite exporter TauE/SafE family protein [Roseovarius albus]SLN23050.1 Sulfite exporter TauE/SafE [Roseovarius albus]